MGADGEGGGVEVFSAGGLEESSSGEHGGAGGPDVVEEEINGVGIDFGSESVSFGGLGFALGDFGADLDGIGGAGEECLVLPMAEFGKVFGNDKSMVETAGADMFANGRERDDDNRLV